MCAEITITTKTSTNESNVIENISDQQPSSLASSSSTQRPLCSICKTHKPTIAVEQHCACWHHVDCLRDFVRINQKSRCPLCYRPFEQCRIIKKRRSFFDFVCLPEISEMLGLMLWFFVFAFYFFLIVLTEYGIAKSSIASKATHMLILIPGIVYMFAFIAINLIACICVKHWYQSWCELNYILIML